MSPNGNADVQAITRLVEELRERVGALAASDRRAALASAKSVISVLEDPEEVAFAQIFQVRNPSEPSAFVLTSRQQSPIYNFAIRMGVELGIFRKLVERNGIPVSAADLSDDCKAEELLLGLLVLQNECRCRVC